MSKRNAILKDAAALLAAAGEAARKPRNTALVLVFLGALLTAGAASASLAATRVGALVSVSPWLTAFVPEDGVAHDLFLYDVGALWGIRTEDGTEIYSDRTSCGGVIPIYLAREHHCQWGLRVDLGDRNDRLVSIATWTRASTVKGLIVNGGAGDDFIATSSLPDTIGGGSGKDTINGGSGADVIRGDGGDDTLMGLAGADEIDGGDGVDTANYPGLEAVVITLGDELANDGRVGEGDRLLRVENIGGSQADDLITGAALRTLCLGTRATTYWTGAVATTRCSGGRGTISFWAVTGTTSSTAAPAATRSWAAPAATAWRAATEPTGSTREMPRPTWSRAVPASTSSRPRRWTTSTNPPARASCSRSPNREAATPPTTLSHSTNGILEET